MLTTVSKIIVDTTEELIDRIFVWYNGNGCGTVVARLAEQLHPVLEIHRSNPKSASILFSVNFVVRTKNKEKEIGKWHNFRKSRAEMSTYSAKEQGWYVHVQCQIQENYPVYEVTLQIDEV